MELIFAAACCSVIISILLKLAKTKGFDALQMIVWNYASASLLGFLWFKPDLQHISMVNTPWWLIVALGVLLPSIFLCLAKSLQYAGIAAVLSILFSHQKAGTGQISSKQAMGYLALVWFGYA